LPAVDFRRLPYDPDFEKTMEVADELMDEYRDTLAALAKEQSRCHPGRAISAGVGDV
jgi:hypothetical protein